MKRFSELTEPEILALGVSNEEEDSQIYLNFAHRLQADFPATAKMFEDMAAEEQQHKNMLLELYRKKFGNRLPYITRQDVRGFMTRRPIWLMDKLRVDAVRRQAEMMELEASRFYTKAAARTQDVDVR
ncbi:MAG TPA: ferritin family protein, partial [Patescibacteria group bacterium]|nr:ferritin family protein [Patescibacteria group bacterium]